ncbi:hypothetical protein PG984_015022 [Apiospora sp. TS-2023a]
MSPPTTSFHRFTELPLELRLQIWHLAADQAGSTGPQVLPLLLVHELYWEPPRSYIHIPRRWRTLYLQPRLRARLALLHSCREARAELLQPPFIGFSALFLSFFRFFQERILNIVNSSPTDLPTDTRPPARPLHAPEPRDGLARVPQRPHHDDVPPRIRPVLRRLQHGAAGTPLPAPRF